MAGQRSPLPVRGLHRPSSGQPSSRWRKPSSCRHRLPTLTRTVQPLRHAAGRRLPGGGEVVAPQFSGHLVDRPTRRADQRDRLTLELSAVLGWATTPHPCSQTPSHTRTTTQKCFDQPQPITPTPPHVRRTGLAARGSAPVARPGEGHLNQEQLMPGHRTGSPARRAYTRRGPRPSRLAQRPGIGRDSGNTRTTARYQGRWPWPRHAVPQSGRAGRRWFLRSERTGPAEHRHVTPPCRATTRTLTASSTATRFLSSA